MRLKKHFSHGVAAAVLGMAALGLTAATALGLTPFYAQVGGTANSFQSGTLILSKTIGAGTPCLSSPNSAAGITTNINSACTGSDIGTGTTNSVSSSQSATVTLTNQGSIASTAGLALAASSCTVAAAPYGSSALNPLSSGSDTAGFCSKIDVTIYNGTNCIYPVHTGTCPTISNTYNLTTLAAAGSLALASTLASGASVVLTFTTQLDTTATNADQGLVASIPLTYTLSQ